MGPRDDAGSEAHAGRGKSSRVWTEVAALGRSQDGVFGVEQLHDLGLSEGQLGRAVTDGRLVRRHRGVYGDALVRPTRRSHLVAALLAMGPDAFLSGRTSLAVDCVCPLDIRRIEVTVVADHTPRHGGLVVHRTTIEPAAKEIRVVDGLRVSSPALALVEVAHRESDVELDRLIAELCRRRALDLDRIDAALRRRRRFPGARRLRIALARYRPADHAGVSGFEDAFARWIDGDPDVPSPRRNDHIGPWEVDFHWVAPRVVVETDGDQYHRTPAELERDRVKDAWCQARGIRVLRVTEFRWAHDRAGIRADLHAMLGLPVAA